MVYIVMGVSGSGKTTIGKLLAQKLGLPFYDADDFHPAANISKMEAGTPLTDEDREGWLITLANHIMQWQEAGGAVLACSALKEKYREVLEASGSNKLEWIFLKGSKSLIEERLLDRKGHFMSSALLDSQFQILEEPAYGIVVPVDQSAEKVASEIIAKLQNS